LCGSVEPLTLLLEEVGGNALSFRREVLFVTSCFI
jgi:hypothetical protein